MILTLVIPPEMEAQLREVSARVGQAPEDFVLATLAVLLEEVPFAAPALDLEEEDIFPVEVILLDDAITFPAPVPTVSLDSLSMESLDAALDDLLKELSSDSSPCDGEMTFCGEDIFFEPE